MKTSMTKIKRHLLAVILAGMLGLAPAGYSEVIYRNNFGNNTSSNIALNHANIGWNILLSQNGGAITDASSTSDSRMGVNSAAGKPTNAANVNAPVSLSDTNGIAFLSNGSGATVIYKGLFYTTQAPLSSTSYFIDSFEWYANVSNAGVGIVQRLALKIGSQWYVTDEVNPVQGSFGNFAGAGSSLQSINFNTATWYSLSAGLGGTFSIGSTTNLPAGDYTISAFGLYLDNPYTGGANYNRFDTFTINGAYNSRFWAAGATGGGTGTWSTTATNWAIETGTQGSYKQTDRSTLIFGGTAGTVTVDGTVSVLKGMQFSTDGYEVTGGTAVSLDGTNIAENTITTGDGVGATINSKLTGTHGLAKAGGGTLTLGGANDYTGGTLVSEGELEGTTSSLQGNITNNAVLTFNQSSDGAYSGAISGSGTLNKSGTGTVTFSGSSANTQSGNVTVSNGTLELAKTAGIAAIAGNLQVNSGAKLLLSASNQVVDTSKVTLSGGTIQRASGVSEVFSDLNLTAASFLDYGSGTAGTLTFGTYTPSSLLTVNNFFYGNKLVFANNLSDDITNNTLFSFSHEFTYQWQDDAFTITAIPEPRASVAAACLIFLLMATARWRKLMPR